MKPHLWKVNGMWWCAGDRWLTCHSNMWAAYCKWAVRYANDEGVILE